LYPSLIFVSLIVSLGNDIEKKKMNTDNNFYIDRLGAWAVVAFTLVAGLMVFDTVHCLSGSTAGKPAAPHPASQPAAGFAINRANQSGTNISITNSVEINSPSRTTAPSPRTAHPEKPTKPVPIPNPREIGEASGPGIETVRSEKPTGNGEAR
jgi:hypothetical protein